MSTPTPKKWNLKTALQNYVKIGLNKLYKKCFLTYFLKLVAIFFLNFYTSLIQNSTLAKLLKLTSTFFTYFFNSFQTVFKIFFDNKELFSKFYFKINHSLANTEFFVIPTALPWKNAMVKILLLCVLITDSRILLFYHF